MATNRTYQTTEKGEIVFTSFKGGTELESCLEIQQGNKEPLHINLSELDTFIERLMMWRLEVDLDGMKALAADISIEEFSRNLEFFAQFKAEDEEEHEISIIDDTEEEES